jgi:hypothetical protein
VTCVTWNLISVHLDTVFVLVQERCMVYAKCTIGQKSFWTRPIELQGDLGHVESRFNPFGDGARFVPNIP